MKVYIAGPYSSDPELNTYKAMEMAGRVLESGHTPFVPHLFHFWNLKFPQGYIVWTRLGMEWLELCHALIRLPGISTGVDAELEKARSLSIPIFYSLETFLETATKLEEVLARSGHKFELTITQNPYFMAQVDVVKLMGLE